MMGININKIRKSPQIYNQTSIEENKRFEEYIQSFYFLDSKHASDMHIQSPQTFYGRSPQEVNEAIKYSGGARPRHTGVAIYKKKN